MKKFMERLLMAAMILVVFASFMPQVAFAADPAICFVYDEEELADHNLSIGVIKWKDDLVKGQVTVTPRADGRYDVKIEQAFKIKAKPKTKAGKAKKLAMEDFKAMREFAQQYGWWDCKYKIKSCTGSKVVAKATIEYKAVKVSERSKSITVKITAKKKKGVWTTVYTIDGKERTAEYFKYMLKNGYTS